MNITPCVYRKSIHTQTLLIIAEAAGIKHNVIGQIMSSNSIIVIGAATANPLTVRKPGYGAMRLRGAEIWGEPPARANAIAEQ
jgi:hypothetical protein